ncbi:sigma 54-interacting transcriptional regulator [Geosporobacter ferrireducens]|uniref:Sigma-54-dependent Fis family transcriptional regulator n=1 Tax=Geosporobacter ferrireducens TaxID=1424294 RepID=A0A1D8GQ68_9FIRM|nr:sigma 54-interacting transcriptional regulator [Geosporobacter ferrireducens]AOT73085.1 sigma-54-dependent Fis family transcriptional regulator [Geosporobacter ferrireducens]MTI53250.1 PAS domain S-box protein [Geosporobacter ferrireducens]
MKHTENAYVYNTLKTLIDICDEGIVAIDRDENVTYLNNTAAAMLGVEAKDYIGNKMKNLIEDTTLYRVMKTKKPEKDVHFSKNNRDFIAYRMPIFNGEEVIGALAVFKDITDYNRMDKELINEREHSKILETIFETAYDWVVLVDKDGVVTMMSQTYLDFLGLKKEDAVGRHVTEVIPNTRMHIVAKTGKSEIGEIQEIKSNHMIATRLPIVIDGKVIGAVGKVNFKDISDFNTMAKKVFNMEKELEYYRDELKKERAGKYSFESIVGVSSGIVKLKSMSQKVAKRSSNVLILGESGTGKELFAHAIHNFSMRANGPFIKVNCAAIPSELLESELFGYEEGAFTGAKKGGKIGKFELADKGSIFLDEIGDMDMKMQAKLLRVLQEKEIERVGGNTTKAIDVRIIAATNKKLDKMVEEGKFREDLYYRLNVVTLNIPPLRERVQDIKLLAKYLVDKLCHNMGIIVTNISEEVMRYLTNYSWPGNIRELENVLERALNLLDKETIIESHHLPTKIVENVSVSNGNIEDLQSTLARMEKEIILKCLKSVNGNKKEAAKRLNISRTSLYQKLEKYGY